MSIAPVLAPSPAAANAAVTAPPVGTRAADRVVEVLRAHGVRWVFGVPGAKIDPVFDALAAVQGVAGAPQLITCRTEQNAVFMAAAVGRLTGIPGVVLVTSGPGTANLATGLLTATTEGDPVVAICGAVSRSQHLKRAHQAMDAVGMLQTVTVSAAEVTDAEDCGGVAAPLDTAGDEVPSVSGFFNGREDADEVEIAGFCQCGALLIRTRISHLLVPRDVCPGRQFYNLKSRLSAIGTQTWSNIDE